MNEILLILTLVIEYSAVVLAYRFFGKRGLFAWIVLATILANIEVMMLVEAFGIEMTLGNILFASTFLATDILGEMYDKNVARQGAIIGIASSVCFALISASWLLYQPSYNDINSNAILSIFSHTPRIVAASVIVYAIVQLLDVSLYHKIWELTQKQGDSKSGLWIRNNVATIISQIVNAILYNIIAFAGTYPTKTIVAIIISNVLIYIVTSLADTPFLYWARNLLVKK